MVTTPSELVLITLGKRDLTLQSDGEAYPNRYAGKFCKIALVTAEDVIGVAR